MASQNKTNQELASEVLLGFWGNGQERRTRLTNAGYNYEDVQSIVNALVEGKSVPKETVQNQLKITGTNFLEIEVDLTKYKGINLIFTMGGE